MQIKFSAELSKILELSRTEALRTGSYGMGVDHLALGMLRHGDNEAVSILKRLGVDTALMKETIDNAVFREEAIPFGELENIRPTRGTLSVLNMAAFEALKTGNRELGSEHLLEAVCLTAGNACSDFLRERGVTREKVCALAPSKDTEPTEKGLRVRLEDIAGALSEQIGALMKESGNNSNYLS